MSRFAAYKAEYVSAALNRALNDENTPIADREKFARAVLHTFNRYQDAERSTATARARTAKQFEEFLQPDNVRLFPNLKWLPSRSADPRATHVPFYNHVWSKNDTFWDFNAPGTEWNCKCDIEETDEPVTNDNPQGITKKEDALPGIEGNPAQTGEIFTDNASYIRAYNRSNTQRRKAENLCQSLERSRLQHSAKTNPLLTEKTTCNLNGTEREVEFRDYSITEYAEKMFGTSNYWLKNELLPQMPTYIKKATWVESRAVDLTHNISKKTLRLKRKLQWFHYFRTTLPNGETAIIELVEYKTGKICLYTMIKTMPQ